MPDMPRLATKLQRHALLICLLLQASLLLPRLGLLPVWGDESFTLDAASRSVRGVVQAYADDKVNPPLHGLLVHFWLLIPWPVGAPAAARALSVLFVLLATVVLDRIFAKRLRPEARTCFLLLWTLSPCVLLYGRMARAYSLGVLLFALAFGAALDLLKEPRRPRLLLLFVAWETCLLYTHYLPGLALLAGLGTVAACDAIRSRTPSPAISVALAGILTALLYLPWLPTLMVMLGRMTHAEGALSASSTVPSAVISLGYWWFSFSFGETPPDWALAGAFIVAAGIGYLLWKGVRCPPDWLWLLIPVTVAGYLGAGRWVSFAFVPARLLFLLPFFLLLVARAAERARRAGWIVCGAMLILSAGSASSYYRKTDFLNKGYLLPYGEVAELIRAGSGGTRPVVVTDACNLDPSPLVRQLNGAAEVVLVGRESTLAASLRAVNAGNASLIWFFRSTHDISPGGLNTQLEAELEQGRELRKHLFVPFSARDKLMMKLLGWQEFPTHSVQLVEMRRR